MDSEEQAGIVGAIYLALIEAPPSAEEGAIRIDLLTCPACAGIAAESLAEALATQDDDTLSAVAGRPVTRLSSLPTGVAI